MRKSVPDRLDDNPIKMVGLCFEFDEPFGEKGRIDWIEPEFLADIAAKNYKFKRHSYQRYDEISLGVEEYFRAEGEIGSRAEYLSRAKPTFRRQLWLYYRKLGHKWFYYRHLSFGHKEKWPHLQNRNRQL